MLTLTSGISRLLPLLTITCLATCAVAGLAVGVYDITYGSLTFDVMHSVKFSGLRL